MVFWKESPRSMSLARMPFSLAWAIKYWSCLGGYFSSSILSDFKSLLMADNWSWVSKIWNVDGKPASLWWALNKRLHRPWKVPTHIPLVLIGIMAERRVNISLAALFVKVTAKTPTGEAWPVWINQAILVVNTLVLPLPAPAKIMADWLLPASLTGGKVTASSCSGFKLLRIFVTCAFTFNKKL